MLNYTKIVRVTTANLQKAPATLAETRFTSSKHQSPIQPEPAFLITHAILSINSIRSLHTDIAVVNTATSSGQAIERSGTAQTIPISTIFQRAPDVRTGIGSVEVTGIRGGGLKVDPEMRGMTGDREDRQRLRAGARSPFMHRSMDADRGWKR
jgi:hypothetical protein